MGKSLQKATIDTGAAGNVGRIEKRPRSPLATPSPTSSSVSQPVSNVTVANGTEPGSSVEENREFGTNDAVHTVIVAPRLIKNSVHPGLISVPQVATEPRSGIDGFSRYVRAGVPSLRRETESERDSSGSQGRTASPSMTRRFRIRNRRIRTLQRLLRRRRQMENLLQGLLEGLETEQELLLHAMSQNDEQQED